MKQLNSGNSEKIIEAIELTRGRTARGIARQLKMETHDVKTICRQLEACNILIRQIRTNGLKYYHVRQSIEAFNSIALKDEIIGLFEKHPEEVISALWIAINICEPIKKTTYMLNLLVDSSVLIKQNTSFLLNPTYSQISRLMSMLP